MAQKGKKKTRTNGGPRATESQKIVYLSELRWQEGENLRSEAGVLEPSNTPEIKLRAKPLLLLRKAEKRIVII